MESGGWWVAGRKWWWRRVAPFRAMVGRWARGRMVDGLKGVYWDVERNE